MSKKVKRYRVYGFAVTPKEDPEGGWVRFGEADARYRELSARYAALQKEFEGWKVSSEAKS